MKNFFKKSDSGSQGGGYKGGNSSGGYKGGNSSGGYKGGNSSGGYGGGGNSGGGSWNRGGGGRDGQKTMHSATCASCNDDCKVPFKPNGRKPVLCSDCFEKESGGPSRGGDRGGDRRNDRRGTFDKPAYRSTPREGNGEVMKQLKILNEKMDEILEALTDIGE